MIAWSVISVFGPSSNLEPGALVAIGGVGGGRRRARPGAGRRAWWRSSPTGSPTCAQRRVHHRWIGFAGVVAVVLRWPASRSASSTATAACGRSGSSRRGGNLLAMGFPLFALLAMMAIGGLVVAVVAPRLRLSGGSLRRWLRLGWRRVVLDSGPLVAVVVSAGLAAGCFTVASALAAGAERQLADKAQVYVGADLSVDVFDPVEIPAAWEARATVISKTRVRYGDTRADLVGVDRSRFADVATLRHRRSERVARRARGGDRSAERTVVPAIGVGGDFAVGDVVVDRGARNGSTRCR